MFLIVCLACSLLKPRTKSRHDTTHNGLGPAPSITKKIPYMLAYSQSYRCIFLIEVAASQMFSLHKTNQPKYLCVCIKGVLVMFTFYSLFSYYSTSLVPLLFSPCPLTTCISFCSSLLPLFPLFLSSFSSFSPLLPPDSPASFCIHNYHAILRR